MMAVAVDDSRNLYGPDMVTEMSIWKQGVYATVFAPAGREQMSDCKKWYFEYVLYVRAVVAVVRREVELG